MKLTQQIWKYFNTVFFCMAIAISPTVFAADASSQMSTAQQKVDINSADATTIAQAMDGVGLVKAREIVAYREMNGKFQSIDQLAEVKGIGMATVEKNRDRILVVAD